MHSLALFFVILISKLVNFGFFFSLYLAACHEHTHPSAQVMSSERTPRT